MNKSFKNIFILLISALFSTTVLTGCDGIMSGSDDNSSSTKTMGYLSLSSLSGAIESTAADSSSAKSAARAVTTTKDLDGDSTIVSPEQITLTSVAKVVLKSNSEDSKYQTLGTWQSDTDATETSGNAILKMYADTGIAIPVEEGSDIATYTFSIALYSSDGILLGSGTQEDVVVTKGIYTALDFEITLCGDGAIRLKNCFTVSDRVSKIEAGLFDTDDNAVSVSDTQTLDYEELAVFTDGSDQYAYYVAPEIPAGSYIYKVRVYGKEYSGNDDASGTDTVTGSYSYVIQVDEALTTYSDELTLKNINTIYHIKYEVCDDYWIEGSSPSYSRNNYTTTILPLGSSLYLENYGFVGWHTDEDFTPGEGLVTKISAEDSDYAKDVTFYPEWKKIELNFESVTLHTSQAEDLSVTYEMFDNTTVVVQATSETFDFDHYKWFVNNEYQPEYDDQQVASIYIQFLDGGTYDITVHASKEGTTKDSSAQVQFQVIQLPDFPINYKNGSYLDFTTGDFTGTHETTYAPVFYYGGTTVLDAPTMDYYDFGGYYITSLLDQAENDDDKKEISAIKGTDYEDEITLYAKWNPKNPLNVTIPENSVQNFENMTADKDLKAGSSIYVLGNFEDKEQWYTYQFRRKAVDNLSAELRSNLHRTGEDYYGFYPSSAIASYVDNNSTATKIELNYAGQKQTSDSSTLASYDFMTGKIIGTDLESELNFARLGEKLTFNLTGVPTDKTFKQMVLYVPDTYIPSKGYVDLSADAPAFVCDETIRADKYNHFMMDLDLTSSDGSLAVSVMLPPFDASGKTVIVTLIDSDGTYYNAYFTGETYEAGTDYAPAFADDTGTELKKLPQYKTIAGQNVCPYNYGAYSPEDYGELYTYAQAKELNLPADSSIPAKSGWAAIAESSELTAEAVTIHGVNGIKFTAADGTELFVPANGYSTGSTIVRNSEVNLLTGTQTASGYTYILHGTNEEDENGVMAYSDATSCSYGLRLFY